MKREDIEKHWDIVVAFKEGKTIQFYNTYRECWQDCLIRLFGIT